MKSAFLQAGHLPTLIASLASPAGQSTARRTGIVGDLTAGVGGLYLAESLRYARQFSGSHGFGLAFFAGLALAAWSGIAAMRWWRDAALPAGVRI